MLVPPINWMRTRSFRPETILVGVPTGGRSCPPKSASPPGSPLPGSLDENAKSQRSLLGTCCLLAIFDSRPGSVGPCLACRAVARACMPRLHSALKGICRQKLYDEGSPSALQGICRQKRYDEESPRNGGKQARRYGVSTQVWHLAGSLGQLSRCRTSRGHLVAISIALFPYHCHCMAPPCIEAACVGVPCE